MLCAVVYLDADTVVVSNADELFTCDGLCGVLRHSERINTGAALGVIAEHLARLAGRQPASGASRAAPGPAHRCSRPRLLIPPLGVLVLTPSTRLLHTMLAAVDNTTSYTGGDQGFLNAFFGGEVVSPCPLPCMLAAFRIGHRLIATSTASPQAPQADWAAAPLFDPRQGRLLSEASTWRTAANGTQDLPVRCLLAVLPACCELTRQSPFSQLPPGAQPHNPPPTSRPCCPAALPCSLQLGRLPTGYNADLGLFIANSGRWTLPPADIRVLHYTLAAFKP